MTFQLFLKRELSRFYQGATNGELPLKIPLLNGIRQDYKEMHWHLFPEVFFQLEGSSLFRFPSQNIELNAGEICILPRGIPHREMAQDSKSKNLVIMTAENTTSIHLGSALKGEMSVIKEMIPFNDLKSERISELLDDIVYTYTAEHPYKEDMICATLVLHIAHLLTLIENYKNIGHSANHKVYQCKRIILTHLHSSELNVPQIASFIDCSSDYLSSLFKQETGIGLISYLQQQRINLACDLLANNPLDVNQVSRQVGFSESGYFIKVFKNLIGKTPKAYQKINRSALNSTDT
ncbi:MAG: hypothetical protein COA79_00730 [Planctomycetota bacterium]|nr:MAG: hypothetical protein COA79_00730 [Planctomycetota bacterium]